MTMFALNGRKVKSFQGFTGWEVVGSLPTNFIGGLYALTNLFFIFRYSDRVISPSANSDFAIVTAAQKSR
jgi:hypothetical protein